ncbi:DUF262 and DUF1524 domain-containing protein [Sphingobacterium chuzhouense]|uniref:DUF262 domain-containing protein n=1 Tax=Sphingobacterium chuzhouense TaxID=1742264 RepID=A0ABR7XLD2_9SPHI|nr:DUF262 and DUF1524 domain-containing protein [Sphingobacterium chuzhouense]MBD1419958.1 DUF262 domain-containing protein [Sphingobacterium chuzhouense]
MKATSTNLLTVLKGPKQFVIPIYQRTYSWQLSQCKQLLYDILRAGNDKSISGHFVGSVVYFQESIYNTTDVPQLLIIDGQQRVTTVSLIILGLSEFLKNNEIEIETNASKLKNYYLLNADEDNELRYKLLLTRKDKETYLSLLNDLPLPEKYSQRVFENYQFFRENINRENVNALYNGIMKLFAVDVTLEKGKDNPQLIFESMNSTGLDLSQADLIRNYILMGQEIQTQTRLYEKYWYPMEQNYGNDYVAFFDRFMRDYLSTKTGVIPNINLVYNAFKSYANGLLIEDIVADITEYASYYANMVLLKEKDPDLLKAFKNLKELRVDVSYPFLLAVYNDYSKQMIDKGKFLEVLQLVENYVFRRAICGIATNSLNKTFLTLYKSVNKLDYLGSLSATMQLFNGYKRFPNDGEFIREIKVKDLYNFRSKTYFLSRLENYRRKEWVSIIDYTIEHILPQNENLNIEWQQMLGENWKEIQNTWLHTLGNLTLTGYNSELSDRPFQKKKTIEGGFNQSPLNLNNYLRTVEEWNEIHIQERAGQLAEIAANVWKYPNLSEDMLTRYVEQERRIANEYTTSDYEYLSGEMLVVFYELRKRILELDDSVKEEFKKLYIAYKTSTNFVDIVPQKSRLRLSLNMPFSELIDPENICKDVTDLGRWGNGDVELGVASIEEISKAMGFIQQALDYQDQ